MSDNLKRIPQEEIEQFINGDDPFERIVNLDYKYSNNFISVYYRNEADQKCIIKEPFKPFLWATRRACERLCDGDRAKLKKLMSVNRIGVKKLSNVSIDGEVRHEFDEGYMFMFFAKEPMSYQNFLSFFKKCGTPVYGKRDKDGNTVRDENSNNFLTATPQEQFLISTGKRFFKGYNDYDEIVRMTFDLETTGLDTRKDRIVQLGVRLNRPIPGRPDGFEKIFTVEGKTEEEKDRSELKVITVFFKIIYTFKPDVITAHNGENFDWNMIIGACERLDTSIEEVTSKYFGGESVRKEERESILKLGGEIEMFHQTIVPGTIVTDSLHAVRRAQAIDSNMQRADLKYATEYSGMKKPNRVYTPGDKISEIWADTEHQYAFCDEDGDWYVFDPLSENGVRTRDEFGTDKEYDDYIKSIKSKQDSKPFRMRTRNVLMDGYRIVTGRYIIERYLLDDIWECDRVEWKFNTTNFLICKLLPVPYKKCTTMGTAGQWKALMLAWSYKKGLAIPPFQDTGSFTGGLSRLLRTGYVKNCIKLDYNSLYPSILLTWGIHDTNDLMNTMLSFLEYVLTNREKYKGEKKKSEKNIDKLKTRIKEKTANNSEIEAYRRNVAAFALADGKQMQMKVLGNSFFGSYGSNIGSIFPWKSVKCAEQTTCTGRQSLRLMIGYFSTISERYGLNDSDYNYSPIVGDSVTGDTPLFIRYKDSGLLDIKPISEIIDQDKIEIDELGRGYDYSAKPYQVLCRSGWSDINYVYRHETTKGIYRVEDSDADMVVDVTQDHSLFDQDKNEIKPNEITAGTKLEYYNGKICGEANTKPSIGFVNKSAHALAIGEIDRVPLEILNAPDGIKRFFLEVFDTYNSDILSKTAMAGINYLGK